MKWYKCIVANKWQLYRSVSNVPLLYFFFIYSKEITYGLLYTLQFWSTMYAIPTVRACDGLFLSDSVWIGNGAVPATKTKWEAKQWGAEFSLLVGAEPEMAEGLRVSIKINRCFAAKFKNPSIDEVLFRRFFLSLFWGLGAVFSRVQHSLHPRSNP